MNVQEHFRRIQYLKEEVRREEVALAGKIPPAEKMLAGPRLFERACKEMKACIRGRHPSADDKEVLALLRQALDMVRWLEDLGCVVHLPNDTLDKAYFASFPAADVGSG
jgi:hypothetical protein